MNPARCLVPLVCAASLLGAGLTQGTAAEPVCMNSEEMDAALIDWYQAEPVPGARAADEQIWQSRETGVWALVRYGADGRACVIDKGQLALAAHDKVREGAS